MLPACYVLSVEGVNDHGQTSVSKSRMRSYNAAARTDASNALNSWSFDALYASISFAASERASFSLWTRSAGKDGVSCKPRARCHRGDRNGHWRACWTTFAASFSASRRVWMLWDCCAAFCPGVQHTIACRNGMQETDHGARGQGRIQTPPASDALRGKL